MSDLKDKKQALVLLPSYVVSDWYALTGACNGTNCYIGEACSTHNSISATGFSSIFASTVRARSAGRSRGSTKALLLDSALERVESPVGAHAGAISFIVSMARAVNDRRINKEQGWTTINIVFFARASKHDGEDRSTMLLLQSDPDADGWLPGPAYLLRRHSASWKGELDNPA
ncbi:hypothetical protein CHU98_g6242 [Xylaria longipes]|nr:hypothetical protein CHU98_g6242 [Xylaria longipes]